jgi:TonB family protein
MLLTFAIAALVLQAGSPLQPAPEPVAFQWAAGGRAGDKDGVIALRPSRGWARSRVMYSDFELTFEYRLLQPSSEAMIAVRAQRSGPGGLEGHSFVIGSSDAAFSDGWRPAAIRADAGRLTLTLDDQSAFIDDKHRFAGYVLLRVRGGSAEVRNVVVTRILRPWQPPDGVLTGEALKAQGVKPARLVREVKPTYTRAAMAAAIQGEVHMEAVVLPDGSVGAIHVLRSLHPELDREAVATVGKWKFAPAILDGTPVASLVEVEMTFTLK